MKRKYTVPSKDKKDWSDFTKQIANINIKGEDLVEKNNEKNKIRKLDLHGCTLSDANKIVKKFITESFDNNYKKLLIVTGKGSRSKFYENPYISENLSILKNSVPEYIKNDENLSVIIKKITKAEKKDGGEGAINIFLKDNKKFIK